jgi:hypothetical protein
MKKQSAFPPGWDEDQVRRVLAHSEEQTKEEAVAEDEASAPPSGHPEPHHRASPLEGEGRVRRRQPVSNWLTSQIAGSKGDTCAHTEPA